MSRYREKKKDKATELRSLADIFLTVGIKATKRVLKICSDTELRKRIQKADCLRLSGTGPVPLGFGRHLMHDPISRTHSAQKHS